MEKKTIYESIPLIMQEIGAIGKKQTNKDQKFNFRGIDDVYNQAQPLFAKHKVFTVPFILDEKTEERKARSGNTLIYRVLTMQYRFYAEDGSFVEARVVGEGMDTGDKAGNKAMAIAHKYAILQVLQIPTEDMIDPDIESPEASEPIKEVAKNNLDLIVEKDFDVEKAWYNLVDNANGKEEFVKESLKTLGANKPSEITYEIYKAAWQFIRMGNRQKVK